MPTKIEKWECEYCVKEYRTRGGCRVHEKRCFKNPGMRACASCGYKMFQQVVESVDFEDGYDFGDAWRVMMYIESTSTAYCDFLHAYLSKKQKDYFPTPPIKPRVNCAHWKMEVTDE